MKAGTAQKMILNMLSNRRNGTLRQNTRQLYGIYDPVKR